MFFINAAYVKCVNCTKVRIKMLFTKEHKQAHAYSEDGAGTECGQV